MEKSFGEFLKGKRTEKNLTQKELAKLLIVSESAVSKWEKDVAHPDITLLPKLAEILDVTEHELITASIDKKTREEKVQAKKWRAFSFSWSLFFYISYAIALIPCFICDLAINKGLTWFWIVLSA
ncbi:MAG: helix-turn-helix transcriptional regulator, partial [Clostridia bacterium]|nr:helix-turn-helix transcriptional regulator [Clostridia bacterium]